MIMYWKFSTLEENVNNIFMNYMENKKNLRDLIAATGLVILLKLD